MSTVELVPVGALFTPARMAVAGFLAGYSGRTREAYALDVRMFCYWCAERQVEPFAATRAHIELYALVERPRPGPSHHRPPSLDHRQLLPLP